MTQSKRIAFLGLGVMGYPMAGHLARAGHQVTVYNRTENKAEDWLTRHLEEGLSVHMAATPAQAAIGQHIVITCVGNDRDLAEVMLGDQGALASMDRDALFIDHTTVSPAIARQLAETGAKTGVLTVDAPVSGGQAGAENGKLSIMCGGTEEALAAAIPVMEAYAARITHIGGAGTGQATKAVNQICIAGTLAGLSEAVRFAQASSLDMGKVLEAISGGAAQSWQMENRWKNMAAGEFDFGFAIDWMRKDLAIALAEGGARGLSMPVTALVDQFYAQVQAKGGERQDTSALIRHLPEAND
ncbi:NAD(P)-dependent oxidoreductase [Altericroceibacterium spongiae]|uniref:NAD(P)-dependent oxidoreductase n=1 Tax=Altericroceibacterium spongiae TaxID=2320269 RepID=A0A420EMQ0_9SPHN|nr:NAD(P)-dependent oxidoreductase [Altericroceibacterium spongiae]RKF21958.1 NAD(P)-dependent oxidoreductase [Altericroceibacterium spongiae]